MTRAGCPICALLTLIAHSGVLIGCGGGSDATNAGLTKKYRELQSVLNLPPLQPGSQYVSGKNLDMMGKVLKGSDMGGKPLSKETLQNYLAGRDAQRAELVKSNASSFALDTYDNLTYRYL